MNNSNLETQPWTLLCRSLPSPWNNHHPPHICLVISIMDAPSHGVCNWGIAGLKEEASRPPASIGSIVELKKRAKACPKTAQAREWSMPWPMVHEQSLISWMHAFRITWLTQSNLCYGYWPTHQSVSSGTQHNKSIGKLNHYSEENPVAEFGSNEGFTTWVRRTTRRTPMTRSNIFTSHMLLYLHIILIIHVTNIQEVHVWESNRKFDAHTYKHPWFSCHSRWTSKSDTDFFSLPISCIAAMDR